MSGPVTTAGEGASGDPTASPGDDFEAALAALRVSYIQSLPETVRALEVASADALANPSVAAPVSEARLLSHRLAGTAASYGLEAIGATARELDVFFTRVSTGSAPNDEEFAHARAALQQLATLVEREFAMLTIRKPG